jgi:hypothetical protein
MQITTSSSLIGEPLPLIGERDFQRENDKLVKEITKKASELAVRIVFGEGSDPKVIKLSKFRVELVGTTVITGLVGQARAAVASANSDELKTQLEKGLIESITAIFRQQQALKTGQEHPKPVNTDIHYAAVNKMITDTLPHPLNEMEIETAKTWEIPTLMLDNIRSKLVKPEGGMTDLMQGLLASKLDKLYESITSLEPSELASSSAIDNKQAIDEMLKLSFDLFVKQPGSNLGTSLQNKIMDKGFNMAMESLARKIHDSLDPLLDPNHFEENLNTMLRALDAGLASALGPDSPYPATEQADLARSIDNLVEALVKQVTDGALCPQYTAKKNACAFFASAIYKTHVLYANKLEQDPDHRHEITQAYKHVLSKIERHLETHPDLDPSLRKYFVDNHLKTAYRFAHRLSVVATPDELQMITQEMRSCNNQAYKEAPISLSIKEWFKTWMQKPAHSIGVPIGKQIMQAICQILGERSFWDGSIEQLSMKYVAAPAMDPAEASSRAEEP